MDISSHQTPEEDRIMSRQLYRAGQAKPASKTPAPTPSRSFTPPKSATKKGSATSGDQSSSGQRILMMILLLGVGYFLLYGTPSQKRKTLIGLAVAGWLLMLGGISYCLCLPDLAEMNRERRAIFEDPSLTMDQKFDKIRDMDKNLTPSQRRQMREMGRKEMERKRNSDMYKFLTLTPEEQVAQLKKEAEEWARRREQFRKAFANRPKGGNNNKDANKNGNKGGGNGQRGGGGGPPGGWGGGGGGGGSAAASFGSRNDSVSPESRAGGAYKMGLSQQLGLNSGFGRGGGPGGGGPGGGKR